MPSIHFNLYNHYNQLTLLLFNWMDTVVFFSGTLFATGSSDLRFRFNEEEEAEEELEFEECCKVVLSLRLSSS